MNVLSITATAIIHGLTSGVLGEASSGIPNLCSHLQTIAEGTPTV
jgi:hypothetical protein